MSRPHRESRIVFPWERRTPVLSWFSRRRARSFALAATAALTVLGLASVEDRHRRTFATRAAIRSVALAVEAFRADHGRCPSSVAELARAPERPGGAARPYLAEVRTDGWGRPFHLVCPGRKHPASADVVSGGPSGSFLDLDQVE